MPNQGNETPKNPFAAALRNDAELRATAQQQRAARARLKSLAYDYSDQTSAESQTGLDSIADSVSLRQRVLLMGSAIIDIIRLAPGLVAELREEQEITAEQVQGYEAINT